MLAFNHYLALHCQYSFGCYNSCFSKTGCLFNTLTAHFPHTVNQTSDFAPGLCDTEVMGTGWRGFGDKHRMKVEQKRSRLEGKRLNIRYQLLLTWHKSLKTRGHTKSQLVNEGRFVLAVDLNLDACFVGGLICGYSTPENITTSTVADGNLLFWSGTDTECFQTPCWKLISERYSHVSVVDGYLTDLQPMINYMLYTFWMYASLALLSAIKWRQYVNECILLDRMSVADVDEHIKIICY